MHAVLLHTGKVLFAAGSGNSSFEDPDFGNEAKKVWTTAVEDTERHRSSGVGPAATAGVPSAT